MNTPRTDAAEKYFFSLEGQMQTLCVHQEFARKLERELQGAKQEVSSLAASEAKLRAALDTFVKTYWLESKEAEDIRDILSTTPTRSSRGWSWCICCLCFHTALLS